ncbi:hypothetical protein HHK36_004000 [Tetracentron sinense]|uniref:C2H2-type domain-containing protein n=1 Tax=Tetracentron sinense TaxID=13715 RepID=A0A834ZPA1_TETSI|nr:hypothetical protein HHK36_004000 [Tetracentron sinense]
MMDSGGIGTSAKFPGVGVETGEDFREMTLGIADPRVPLNNLSILQQKMDNVQQFISESLSRNSLIGKDQLDMVSTEIVSAIHQIIVNGAALIACSQQSNLGSQLGEGTVLMATKVEEQLDLKAPTSSMVTGNLFDPSHSFSAKIPMSSLVTAKAAEAEEKSMKSTDPRDRKCSSISAPRMADLEIPTSSLVCGKRKDRKLATAYEEVKEEIDDAAECEIVELDAVELLAEHIHFCDICGKGFKRDANLRMHMRAHGEQFKTPEALAKPERFGESIRKIRFSCPFVACNRNKSHKKFRPLKSVICVKNHFKRSHCPKMFSCNRCNKKSFSVLADLKSHIKHCGESKWRCSCGTSFSRKDKLFGHMTLFEGHMPAIAEEDGKSKGAVVMEEEEEEEETQMEEGESTGTGSGSNNGFFDNLLESFGTISSDCFNDLFVCPSLFTGLMDDFHEI